MAKNDHFWGFLPKSAKKPPWRVYRRFFQKLQGSVSVCVTPEVKLRALGGWRNLGAELAKFLENDAR